MIGALQKNAEPVQKITIVPRTMGALGYVMQVPEEEKYLNSKAELHDMIVGLLGGRAAEEVKFNSVTTGASNDIERATAIARAMVTQYGMSDKFGLIGLESVQNKYLRKILEMYFVENKEFVDAFKKHSAAKSVHHGFMGGLLEHTLSVTDMCQYFAEHYPMIHRDLLITAALFHDMGKIQEISDFPMNDYTDDGQLLGHIYIGARCMENAAAQIPNFPPKLKNELVHCILAHHGKMEFGSPKVPAIMEAMALHMADNADAKLQTLTEVFTQAGDNMGWLGFNRMFESNLRKTSEE